VSRINSGDGQFFNIAKRIQISRQWTKTIIKYIRAKNRRYKRQNMITSQQETFFSEEKANMSGGMSRSIEDFKFPVTEFE